MTQESTSEDARLIVQTTPGCRFCMRGEMHPNVISITGIKAEEFNPGLIQVAKPLALELESSIFKQ